MIGTRDDWRYFEEEPDEQESVSVSASTEKQCASCRQWIDGESHYCVWCGKPQE